MTYTPFPPVYQDSITTRPDPRNTVTMRQARLALYGMANPNAALVGGVGLTGATLLDVVNAVVAASADQTIPIWWEYTVMVYIDDPLVYELGTQIGLTQQQIEQLFTTASTL